MDTILGSSTLNNHFSYTNPLHEVIMKNHRFSLTAILAVCAMLLLICATRPVAAKNLDKTNGVASTQSILVDNTTTTANPAGTEGLATNEGFAPACSYSYANTVNGKNGDGFNTGPVSVCGASMAVNNLGATAVIQKEGRLLLRM
jgi:hypothetical protein